MELSAIQMLLILAFVLVIIIVLCMRNKPDCGCGDHCPCKDKNNTTRKMVKVWTQHFIYTRLVMMAYFSDSPELNDLVNRLLENQQDIGKLMSELYGTAAGGTIAIELTKHITIAEKVLKAVRYGASDEQANAIEEFYANAKVIGDYLDKLLRTNKFKHHLYMHIKLLVDDVIAYTSKNYPNDIKALDLYVNAGLDMAFDMVR